LAFAQVQMGYGAYIALKELSAGGKVQAFERVSEKLEI
jgi:hypothetical protein